MSPNPPPFQQQNDSSNSLTQNINAGDANNTPLSSPNDPSSALPLLPDSEVSFQHEQDAMMSPVKLLQDPIKDSTTAASQVASSTSNKGTESLDHDDNASKDVLHMDSVQLVQEPQESSPSSKRDRQRPAPIQVGDKSSPPSSPAKQHPSANYDDDAQQMEEDLSPLVETDEDEYAIAPKLQQKSTQQRHQQEAPLPAHSYFTQRQTSPNLQVNPAASNPQNAHSPILTPSAIHPFSHHQAPLLASNFGLTTKLAIETLSREINNLYSSLSTDRFSWVWKSIFELGIWHLALFIGMHICCLLLLLGTIFRWRAYHIEGAPSATNINTDITSDSVVSNVRITIELVLLLLSIFVYDVIILLESWKKHKGTLYSMKKKTDRFLKYAENFDIGDSYRYDLDSMHSVAVFRDGKWTRLPYSLLAKGDVLYSRFPHQHFEHHNVEFELIPNLPHCYLLKSSVLPNLIRQSLPPIAEEMRRPVHVAVRLFTKPFALLLACTLVITILVNSILLLTDAAEYNWIHLMFYSPVYLSIFLLPVGFPIIWILIHVLAKSTLIGLQTTLMKSEHIDDISSENQHKLIQIPNSLFLRLFAQFAARLIDPDLDDIFHLGSIRNLCCVDSDGILAYPNCVPVQIFMVQTVELEGGTQSQTQTEMDADGMMEASDEDIQYGAVSSAPPQKKFVKHITIGTSKNATSKYHTYTPEDGRPLKGPHLGVPQNSATETTDSKPLRQTIQEHILESSPVTPVFDDEGDSQRNDADNHSAQESSQYGVSHDEAYPQESQQDVNQHPSETEQNLLRSPPAPQNEIPDDHQDWNSDIESQATSLAKNLKPDGLLLDLLCDDITNDVTFEDQNWEEYLTLLKAMGFSFLISSQMMPDHDLNPIDDDQSFLWKPHLYKISKLIGFEDDILHKVTAKMKITTRRSQNHIVGRVINFEGAGLQLHSYGDPNVLLDYCIDYFDGFDIRPITKDVKAQLRKKYRDWKEKKNFVVVGFSYKPVDGRMKPLIHSYLHKSIIIEEEDVVNEDSDEYRFLNMQQGQIFLGMIAFQKRSFEYLTDFFQNLSDDAGIRFSYFSETNLYATKAFGQNLGLESTWNSCISLSDPSKPVELDAFYRNARLPVGIDAIKKHIREVDDVPLGVSLFCDVTPTSIRQMMDLLQKDDEIVCCVGSSTTAKNLPLFTQADISVAIDPFVPRASDASFTSRYEHVKEVTSAPCSFHISEKSSPYAFLILFHLIKECRRQVANIQQSFLFLMGANLCLYLIQLVGSGIFLFPAMVNGLQAFWMMLIIIPIFSVALMWSPADPQVMNLITLKHGSKRTFREVFGVLVEIFLRFVIPIPICIVLNVWVVLGMLSSVESGHRVDGLLNYWFAQIPSDVYKSAEFDLAVLYGQNFMLFYLIIHFCFISTEFISELHSLVKVRVWSNVKLLLAIPVAIVLQVLFTLAQVAIARSEVDKDSPVYPSLPFYFYLIFIVFPPLNLIVPEVIKSRKRKRFARAQTKEKLWFGTRLGMHSPR